LQLTIVTPDAAQFGVVLNGVVIPPVIGSLVGTLTGTVIISVPAGASAMFIRNVSSGPSVTTITLPGNPGGTGTAVNASVTLLRLS